MDHYFQLGLAWPTTFVQASGKSRMPIHMKTLGAYQAFAMEMMPTLCFRNDGSSCGTYNSFSVSPNHGVGSKNS
jgi:hypothetical protein